MQPDDKPAFVIPMQLVVHASSPEEAAAIAARLEGVPVEQIDDVVDGRVVNVDELPAPTLQLKPPFGE